MIFISQNRGAQNKATPIVYNAYFDSKGQEHDNAIVSDVANYI